jgi:hypothetical protein
LSRTSLFRSSCNCHHSSAFLSLSSCSSLSFSKILALALSTSSFCWAKFFCLSTYLAKCIKYNLFSSASLSFSLYILSLLSWRLSSMSWKHCFYFLALSSAFLITFYRLKIYNTFYHRLWFYWRCHSPTATRSNTALLPQRPAVISQPFGRRGCLCILGFRFSHRVVSLFKHFSHVVGLWASFHPSGILLAWRRLVVKERIDYNFFYLSNLFFVQLCCSLLIHVCMLNLWEKIFNLFAFGTYSFVFYYSSVRFKLPLLDLFC